MSYIASSSLGSADRAVDAQGRFRLREASELDGFDGQLFARLRPTGWELRPVGPAGTVVVSIDGIRIVVWPSSCIDTLLEETHP